MLNILLLLLLLSELEKHEHLDFPLPKIGLFYPCIYLLLFSQSFSAKTNNCKFEFPDYSFCFDHVKVKLKGISAENSFSSNLYYLMVLFN